MTEQVKDKYVKLISEGKLEKAISYIKDKGFDSLLDDLVLLESRISELEKQNIKGFLSGEDYLIGRTKISYSALALIKKTVATSQKTIFNCVEEMVYQDFENFSIPINKLQITIEEQKATVVNKWEISGYEPIDDLRRLLKESQDNVDKLTLWIDLASKLRIVELGQDIFEIIKRNYFKWGNYDKENIFNIYSEIGGQEELDSVMSLGGVILNKNVVDGIENIEKNQHLASSIVRAIYRIAWRNGILDDYEKDIRNWVISRLPVLMIRKIKEINMRLLENNRAMYSYSFKTKNIEYKLKFYEALAQFISSCLK